MRLMPCVWCGSRDVHVKKAKANSAWSVHCRGCEERIEFYKAAHTKEEAAELWNYGKKLTKKTQKRTQAQRK